MSMVLIIEDDHDTRVELRKALEDEGMTVFSAANGAQGYALLQQLHGFVVVVLDQNMPIASGDEFFRLKAQNPRFDHVPVIVISAVGNRVEGYGPVGYLKKPFDLPRLIEMIHSHSPATFWPSEAS